LSGADRSGAAAERQGGGFGRSIRWRGEPDGVWAAWRRQRFVEGHHLVRDHVHALRNGFGAADGPQRGAGRVGAAECFAAEAGYSCSQACGSRNADAKSGADCAWGFATGEFVAGQSAAARGAACEPAGYAGACAEEAVSGASLDRIVQLTKQTYTGSVLHLLVGVWR
jgi:hypothetical protein